MRRIIVLMALAVVAAGVHAPLPANDRDRDRDRELDAEPPPRDPIRTLPGRGTGEAVLGGRDAFQHEPQFQIGRRDRRQAEPDAAEGVQLAGSAQTMEYACDIGERVELIGSDNMVTITGQCLGLNIVGDGNQVDIDVVDDVRIQGDGNDLRWGRGFTLARPDVIQLDGNNSTGPKR